MCTCYVKCVRKCACVRSGVCACVWVSGCVCVCVCVSDRRLDRRSGGSQSQVMHSPLDHVPINVRQTSEIPDSEYDCVLLHH